MVKLLFSLALALVVGTPSASAMTYQRANPNAAQNCQAFVVWYSSADFGHNPAKAEAWRESKLYSKYLFCSLLGY